MSTYIEFFKQTLGYQAFVKHSFASISYIMLLCVMQPIMQYCKDDLFCLHTGAHHDGYHYYLPLSGYQCNNCLDIIPLICSYHFYLTKDIWK